jgi:hypothetical protein
MAKDLTATPAGLVAVLISAKKSGDAVLKADVERQLRQQHGIEIKFATDIESFKVPAKQGIKHGS